MSEINLKQPEASAIERLAKEITWVRAIALGVIAILFFGASGREAWSSKADAAELKLLAARVTLIEHEKTLSEAMSNMRLSNLERQTAWMTDTMWKDAKRKNLPDVEEPPKPLPLPLPLPTPMVAGAP